MGARKTLYGSVGGLAKQSALRRQLAENQAIVGDGIIALTGRFLEHRKVEGAGDSVGTGRIHRVKEPMERSDVLGGWNGVDEAHGFGATRIVV